MVCQRIAAPHKPVNNNSSNARRPSKGKEDSKEGASSTCCRPQNRRKNRFANLSQYATITHTQSSASLNCSSDTLLAHCLNKDYESYAEHSRKNNLSKLKLERKWFSSIGSQHTVYMAKIKFLEMDRAGESENEATPLLSLRSSLRLA
ncbi:hypothetical protein D918_04242 [Trichuris suis]|nr:hypothetical protein D918_04242 [Trichuris suis]